MVCPDIRPSRLVLDPSSPKRMAFEANEHRGEPWGERESFQSVSRNMVLIRTMFSMWILKPSKTSSCVCRFTEIRTFIYTDERVGLVGTSSQDVWDRC